MRMNQLNARRNRRGVLLLLVLSMLTIFLMLGALMLVLATRARTSARAFATASNAVSSDFLRMRAAVDEALMRLLRGSTTVGSVTESILADRCGSVVAMGQLTNLTRVNAGLLRAQLSGVSPATPLALNGRVLTIKPPPSDPATISSYRIVGYLSGTVDLANLRTSMPFRTLPAAGSVCMAIINGRDFDNSSGNEAWDAPDTANQFLTEARLQDMDASILVTRPAFGATGQQCEVDNDGDGMSDGIWLANVLPPQQRENGSSITFRVSYMVLDLDGRFNVNAHGLRSGVADNAIGPASVDGSAALGSAAWSRLLGGGDLPPPTQPVIQQRRPTPVLGYAVDGRFGTITSSTASPYDLRLDFDGPRPGSPVISGDRVNFTNLASLFTAGEMERLMRPFDSDASALPPRLAGIMGDGAQRARMRITTDSWDTTGLVGQAASKVAAATAGSATGLPQSVIDGRRFDINASMTNPTTYADFLYNLVVVLGVTSTNTRQWVANVIDYRDNDPMSQGTTLTISGTSVTGYETGLGNPADERFKSIGELLRVPQGSKSDIEDPENHQAKRSLAVDYPVILDAVMVSSPFATTLAANPWREPGRVNVNTCDDDVWKAVLRESQSNPFSPPAQSTGDILTNQSLVFSSTNRFYTEVNLSRVNRLANIATPRSNVFAVWVTVEITDTGSPDQPKTYGRLFAIVDRSIPVGYSPGMNLNARDTLRLVRYLD